MKERLTIKWLTQKAKTERWKIWLLNIANILFSALSVFFAFAVKIVVDGATNNDKDKLIYGSITLAGAIVLQFVLRLFIHGLTEHVQGKLEIVFKSNLFEKIINKRYDKITEYHSGELMNRITNDVSVISDAIAKIVPDLFATVARLVFAVCALVYIDWIFAIAFSVAGLLVFLTIALMRNKLKGLHKSVQTSEGKVRSFMQECIENLLAIKVYTVNGKIKKKADDLQKDNFDVKMKRKNYAVLGNATYNLIFSLGYIFALIYGGFMIFYNLGMTYGNLIAILQLVNNVQVPFATMANTIPKYFAMIASAERLIEIENIKEENVFDHIDRDEIYKRLKSIEYNNVCFSYDRDTVIENSSFSIKKGEFLVVSGPSGTGKSTIIKLLLGVYIPTSGSILLNCENERIIINSSTRNLFSFVPQGNMLFSGSLRENITFTIGSDVENEKIYDALLTSCCIDFIKDLPQGIDTIVGEKGVGLSEGQIQRIAIARALLSNAPILLLDESTSALDEKTEKKLLNNLIKLENKTIIFITHKKTAKDICTNQVCLKGKKIITIK